MNGSTNYVSNIPNYQAGPKNIDCGHREFSATAVSVATQRHLDPIVGTSEELIRAKRHTEQAKGLRILFYGETGVGKTPFARYSNEVVCKLERRDRPFEQLNCACLTPEQFQDTLFGHRKGAFTGAISDKMGLVEIAAGGDLFLDEIGDMPLSTQAHFLTFLDTMEYYRLGDDRKRRANVRVLCATNRDLRKMAEEGRFRKDLFSRISQVIVSIPSLRDRKQDLRPLVEYFIAKFSGFDKPYDPRLIEILQQYDWKEGNVRELRDCIEFLCFQCSDRPLLTSESLGDRFRNTESAIPAGLIPGADSTIPPFSSIFDVGLEQYVDCLEGALLRQLLSQFDGCMETLADRLKTSRSTLYRRLRKYGLLDGTTEMLAQPAV